MPNSSTTRRTARGLAAERTILDATFAHVRRFGYDGTTISAIVAATGRPASSIYHLFGNKDALITRALEHGYPEVSIADAWVPFDPAHEPGAQLAANIRRVLDDPQREDSVRVGLMLALEGNAAGLGVQEPFAQRRRETVARFRAWWAGLLDPAQADRMAALTLWWIDGHIAGDRDTAGTNVDLRARSLARTLLSLSASEFVTAPASPLLADAARSTDPLLRTTRDVVAQRGYAGATVDRITAAAGLTKPEIYERFASKDELIAAAVAGQFLEVIGTLADLGPAPQAAKLTTMLTADLAGLQARAAADPALTRAGQLLALQRLDPPTAGGEQVRMGAGGIDKRLEVALTGAAGTESPRVSPRGRAWMYTRLKMGIVVSSALGTPEPQLSASMAHALVQAILSA